MRALKIGALLFTAAIVLAGAANAQETLKIGMIGDLSGAAAVWGKAVQGGVELAAKETNAAGGLKVGGKTYKIEVIAYDDQYNAAKAVTAANRLIDQDGVKFVFGTFSSAGALATKPIMEDRKVINFVGAYTKKVFDANTKYVYRAISTPTEFITPMLTWLKEKGPKNLSQVALMNPNDEAGWDGQELQLSVYPKFKFTVVGKELYERSVKDFQPALTRILAANPDLIELGTSAPVTAGLIVRQARDMGYKGQFIKNGGPGPRQIVAGAGKAAAEGVINYMYADETDPTYQRINADFKKQHGHDMDGMLINFYDATKVLFAAIVKAGTVSDTEKVAAALAQVVPFKSVAGGEIKLTGKANYGIDHQIETPTYIGVIHDGEPKIVFSTR
jgi:branched-chain amino acid transport system substrate-binding protein